MPYVYAAILVILLVVRLVCGYVLSNSARLLSDDQLDVTLLGVSETSYGYYKAHLLIQNKTSERISVSGEYMCINGFSFYVGLYTDLSPHEIRYKALTIIPGFDIPRGTPLSYLEMALSTWSAADGRTLHYCDRAVLDVDAEATDLSTYTELPVVYQNEHLIIYDGKDEALLLYNCGEVDLELDAFANSKLFAVGASAVGTYTHIYATTDAHTISIEAHSIESEELVCVCDVTPP